MRTFDYESFQKSSIPSDVRMYLTMILPYQEEKPFLYGQKSGVFEYLAQKTKHRSAGASNRIEGISTTDKRLIALVDGKIAPHSKTEKEILGYCLCLEKVFVSNDNIPITPDYILELHADLYHYLSTNREGRFKSIDNMVEATDAAGEKSVLFVPAPAAYTQQAIADLCDTYNRAMEKEAMPPLVLIMQFVFDFMCIKPFSHGNGRMSRLLMLLLLNRCGFPVVKYISLDAMIEKTKDSYFNALKESGLNWHQNTDPSWEFIRYMLGILLAAYHEMENRVL